MTDTDQPPSADPRRDPAIELDQSPAVAIALDTAWLRSRLADALPLIEQSVGRLITGVSIRITDDRQMIDLNRAYTGEDHTTDVLSFDFADGEPSSPIQADLVVCADEAARRATEFGHTTERELLLYCIHGVLHCAGFDDHTDTGFAAMHQQEDRILMAIGVGATFAAPPRAAAPGQDVSAPGERGASSC